MPPCVLSLKTPSDILGRRPDCQVQLRSGNSPVLLEAHCLSCDTCPLILGPAGGAIIASYLLWLISLHLFQLVIAGAETEGERGFWGGGRWDLRSHFLSPAPKALTRRRPSTLNCKLCQRQAVRSLEQYTTKGILSIIHKSTNQKINPVLLKLIEGMRKPPEKKTKCPQRNTRRGVFSFITK